MSKDMENRKKSNSARKGNIFGSLRGLFCQCGDGERRMEYEKEQEFKARTLSSDISTTTTSELFREIDEEELLVKINPYECMHEKQINNELNKINKRLRYKDDLIKFNEQINEQDYKPCIVTKPAYWHPISDHEISHDKKNVNLYTWGRYHAFLGKGKYIGQKPIGLIEPKIDLKSENSIKVSLRFNKFEKVCGFGLGFDNLTEGINYNLGSVVKRRNQWIQENMLNPEIQHSSSLQKGQNHNNNQQQPQSPHQNQFMFNYGGIYITHEKGSDKSQMVFSDRIDQVPISWKEKDHIILEYFPSKNLLKIQVINCVNLESKSYNFQIDLEQTLSKEEKEKCQSAHFLFLLDQMNDHVEILGDPDANHIKQKLPPSIKNIHFYDLSQKYYLDQSCCSTRIKFENKSMDCVLVQSDNYYQLSDNKDETSSYMFAYFKPCLPFPNEKLYIKRIGLLIQNQGEGDLFVGLTREAHAIHNADLDTTAPHFNWHGRKMLFTIPNPNSYPQKTYNMTNQIIIIEYNPFTDCLTMISQDNQRNVLNNLYADFTDKEFEDKSNRYCFCIGGASNMKVYLYNDYYEDILDTLTQ